MDVFPPPAAYVVPQVSFFFVVDLLAASSRFLFLFELVFLAGKICVETSISLSVLTAFLVLGF